MDSKPFIKLIQTAPHGSVVSKSIQYFVIVDYLC